MPGAHLYGLTLVGVPVHGYHRIDHCLGTPIRRRVRVRDGVRVMFIISSLGSGGLTVDVIRVRFVLLYFVLSYKE